MNQGLLQLIQRAPAVLGRFEGTELGLPAGRALFGKEPELPALLEAAHRLAAGEIKDALPIALALAEAIESAQLAASSSSRHRVRAGPLSLLNRTLFLPGSGAQPGWRQLPKIRDRRRISGWTHGTGGTLMEELLL